MFFEDRVVAFVQAFDAQPAIVGVEPGESAHDYRAGIHDAKLRRLTGRGVARVR